MAKFITDTNLDKVLNNYYSLLANMGYVQQEVSRKVLLYVFLLDFMNTVGRYIDEEDYDLLTNIYRKISAGAGCILPYSSFCSQRPHVVYPKN